MHKFFMMGVMALLALSCAQTPEKRAQELISKLTLEEKTSLMMHPSAPVEALGIPAYDWWNEALHGVARNGKATVFPMPIAMAASFDEPLVNEVFTAVSDEARVKNRWAVQSGHVGQYQGLTFWTPNINIFRDPRWGRGMETYGEDPYLTGQLGMAVVRGLQGPSDAKVLKAHACAKHFAVHSGPEWNRHSYNAVVSERDLRETYLPAFKDLVTKADVKEVMIAYNAFRGVPCGYSEDGPHAAATAIHTGTDLNCGDSYRFIPEAVQKGLLDEADVDRSLVRLLSERIRLGELEHNTAPWDYLSDDIVEGPEHRALSRKMAEETIVLLQNKGGILPLKEDARIAVVGPNADDREMMWGNYNPIPENTVTLLEGLKARFPNLVSAKGCGIVGEKEEVKALLEQLEGKDIVIFAGGISPRFEGEEMDVDAPGFRGGDRTSIELPVVQRELLKALHDAGKKVVLVNFSGCAMGLVPETESCEAILQAWYPGEEGGTVLADVLLGDVVPSGKLPLTFYKNVDQLPDFEDYNMKGRTYRFFEGEPLYPFGYGLSYTTFEYGKARTEGSKIIIPVTNTGSSEATEVVQLYVKKTDDAEGPLKSLRGFSRVTVVPGQTVEVELPLTAETFLSWNEQKQDMVPEKGTWELLYGGNSHDLQSLTYQFN